MLDSGELPLAPQWLNRRPAITTTRISTKKTSGQSCGSALVNMTTTTTTTMTSTLQSPQNVYTENNFVGRQLLSHRPYDYMDERGEARPEGRKQLRRTNSEVHCLGRPTSPGGIHTRSQSALDNMPQSMRHILRRTPDAIQTNAQGTNSMESGRCSSQGGRRSRLAELPETCESSSRHSPESRAETLSPTVTMFSRLIESSSPLDDIDAAEIQRIQFEQSKKLVPLVPTRSTPRGRKSSKSPLTPLGKRSPVSNTLVPITVKSDPNPMATRHIQKNDPRMETGFRDRHPEGKSKEQDRDTFFRSLLKNKSASDKCTCEFLESGSAELNGDSTAVVSVDYALTQRKKEEKLPFGVVPPSVEEERFLRSLGWSDADQEALLTDEEIASFRARYSNKTIESDSHTLYKSGPYLRTQCSPVGHFSSFDLGTDESSESISSSGSAGL